MKAHQDRLNAMNKKKFTEYISKEKKQEKLMDKAINEKEDTKARYMKYQIKEQQRLYKQNQIMYIKNMIRNNKMTLDEGNFILNKVNSNYNMKMIDDLNTL